MASDTFKALAKGFLVVANAAVAIGAALKPLLPLIAIIGTFKLGGGLLKVINFARSGGAKEVAGVSGMARGGLVPGAGSGDTVPAMLTPGEFVIRKSAVQAVGTKRLSKINRYAGGGKVNWRKHEEFLGIDDTGLGQTGTTYKGADALPLAAAVKGGIKGALFEKFVANKLGKGKILSLIHI